MNLLFGVGLEDHLWRHKLYLEDVYDVVVGEAKFKIFPDGGHEGRHKIVGPDKGGRLLTFIVKFAGDDAVVITGWPADSEERTLYSRRGGAQNV